MDGKLPSVALKSHVSEGKGLPLSPSGIAWQCFPRIWQGPPEIACTSSHTGLYLEEGSAGMGCPLASRHDASPATNSVADLN